MLEHLGDIDRHIASLHQALRPGGRLFVFVPAFAVLWTSLNDEVGHVRRFTRASVTGAFSGHGRVGAHSRYFDLLGFPVALGVRVLEFAGACSYSPGTVGFYGERGVGRSTPAEAAADVR